MLSYLLNFYESKPINENPVSLLNEPDFISLPESDFVFLERSEIDSLPLPESNFVILEREVVHDDSLPESNFILLEREDFEPFEESDFILLEKEEKEFDILPETDFVILNRNEIVSENLSDSDFIIIENDEIDVFDFEYICKTGKKNLIDKVMLQLLHFKKCEQNESSVKTQEIDYSKIDIFECIGNTHLDHITSHELFSLYSLKTIENMYSKNVDDC